MKIKLRTNLHQSICAFVCVQSNLRDMSAWVLQSSAVIFFKTAVHKIERCRVWLCVFILCLITAFFSFTNIFNGLISITFIIFIAITCVVHTLWLISISSAKAGYHTSKYDLWWMLLFITKINVSWGKEKVSSSQCVHSHRTEKIIFRCILVLSVRSIACFCSK